MNRKTMMSLALDWAKLKKPIFPCSPEKKSPLVNGGFNAATVEESKIREWWQQFPNAMVGMPTGDITDIFVLDVDEHGKVSGNTSLAELETKHGTLPETLEVLTPGGGRHLYFKNVSGLKNSAGKVGAGLDIRANGGYIIAPGSINSEGKEYTWVNNKLKPAIAPDWLVNLATRKKKPPKQVSDAYAKKAQETAVTALLIASEGTRNETLNKQAFGLFGLVKAGRLNEAIVKQTLEAAAIGIGLDTDEVRKTMDSAFEAAEPRYEGQNGKNDLPPQPVVSQTGSREVRGGLQVEFLNRVKPKPVDWMWEGKYAFGKFGLLAGMPDVGKTTVLMDLVARMTRGACWPCSNVPMEPGKVLLLSAEDDTADTLLPRLMAAGADVNNVIRIRSAVETDEDGNHVAKSFTLSQSLGLLDAALKSDPNIRLVVMDPLSAYLGVRNAHSDADVRTVMDPVVDMLEQRKVALIGNAHLNKRSDAQHVMQLITGSGAIVAVARTTYLAAKVDGDLDRYFLKVKANVSKESDSHGLIYRIESATVHDDEGNPIQTSKVVWKGIWTETADQFYQRISGKGKAPKKVAAQLWLRNFLEDGPMPAREVQEASEHAAETLKRAANELGIKHQRMGFGEGGCWYWFLPEQWAEYETLLATGISTEKALAQVIKYPALPKMVNLKVAK